jgi:AcrR family transcriptional regulator
MFTEMKKRPYRQKQRAAQQEETRLRIVEAMMALHEELGPRDTTIAAVAERAGVQRLTVYRHFPDADAMFRACTAHWLSLHPPPEPDAWRGQARPKSRARAALRALYAYYRGTAPMWARVYRDVDDLKALQTPVAEFEQYLDTIVTDLAGTWAAAGAHNILLDAAVVLATRFRTWETLDRQGIDDDTMAELMASCCAAMARADAPAVARTDRPRRRTP